LAFYGLSRENASPCAIADEWLDFLDFSNNLSRHSKLILNEN